MKVLVFADHRGGKATKASLEAATYAKRMGADVEAVTTEGLEGDGGLGAAGVSTVHVADGVNPSDSAQLTKMVAAAADATGAEVVVVGNDNTGRLVAPRVAVRLDAGLVSGAVALPDTSNDFTVRKNVFSGKATADVSITSAKKVIAVMPNAIGIDADGGSANVSALSVDAGSASVMVREQQVASGDGMVPLPEAELVVSAGRGLKGPENWGMIEDLAKALGATTACSRPVSDMDWRPHYEHVGQTGVAIRPNLYIAVGISGAIQHLAGVNGSKVIVVINKDPEAPFFKAADYGIVGDAFEVVPKLVEAAQALN